MAHSLELDKVVIRFAGDSGDGMQLTGSQFSFTSALFGNELATFPDFPAEIRAPQGTVEGVSGFQVQIGATEILTPGDQTDVLIAMNPAALKANLKWLRKGGNIIIDADQFDARNLEKAGYTNNPATDDSLAEFSLLQAPITTLTKTALAEITLDNKSKLRCKNMFALGMMYWLFSRSLQHTIEFIDAKFKGKDDLLQANKKALNAGYFYAETVEALPSSYKVAPAKVKPGKYRHISGNIATAWGLMAAAEKLNRKLFYGTYPITPASDILHELSRHKNMGVITLQAEDEIAAVCSAIGASYAGQLGVTASAGPGIALKSEAIGLAAMVEIPLVIVDVQRGGPSTGLPTKTEQGDLSMALGGRNSDNPILVIAGSTPSNCFHFIYQTAKLSVEHNTPAMFLSDAYLANGSEPWLFPSVADLPDIHPPKPELDQDGKYLPYKRDRETLVRAMAAPGTKGFEHRVGGLEKDKETGSVSYDPANHDYMTRIRAEKVKRIAKAIPDQKLHGEKNGDLLVVGWGSTEGSLLTAVNDFRKKGEKVALAQFNYLSPLPANTAELFSSFKKILVCELNLGQFAAHLRNLYPQFQFKQYNKVQGLPFTVSEITTAIQNLLESK